MELFNLILNQLFMMASRFFAMYLFCRQLKRRNYYFLRLTAVIIVLAGLEFIPLNFLSNLAVHCIYNTAVYLFISLLMWFCFREKYFSVLFCCVAGKCVMHLSEYLCWAIYSATGNPIIYVSIVIYAIIYVALHFLFARRIKSSECLGIDNWKTVLFAFTIVAITDILMMAFTDITSDSLIKVLVYLMNVIICFLTLCLQFGLLTELRIKREAQIINQLRIKEQEQYEISKDAIMLIGIKHHDIKNMLESHKDKFSEQEINSINQLLDSYDVAFKTGNGTLDAILTEKFIACKRMNIRLESLVNGEPINFMSDTDIYSLFLNALNNAIESADKIAEEDKRIIWLKVYTKGQLLCIQTQNYYSDEIVFNHDKTIETTKEDKRFHGYGLQSIKMIVEHYGGSMSVNTDNKMFSLGIVIPIPENLGS